MNEVFFFKQNQWSNIWKIKLISLTQLKKSDK